ncbi:MAG: hypothetical protein WDW38_005183 [Sanguina aurantia]
MEHAQLEDDETAERSPDNRYHRSTELVGKGRFKKVYKAFDSQNGIDVAWSKISAEANNLSPEQLSNIANDIRTGLKLDHPNIIKCFQCWEDEEAGCINLITELFTSGNLRQYRTLHRNVDPKASKRMARQILKGLQYLHSMQPPITHGDLRCDKIYVNGHSGEIKIGDLGLATLLPLRWEAHDRHKGGLGTSTDIYAFGLCLLELLSQKHFDPQHCTDWEGALRDITEEGATDFIGQCLGPVATRPSAEQLLEDPFLPAKKAPAATDKSTRDGGPGSGGGNGGGAAAGGSAASAGSMLLSSMPGGGFREKRASTEELGSETGGGGGGDERGSSQQEPIAVKEGKLHFRLTMTEATEVQGLLTLKRTIDFVFDPDVDTADSLAGEISEEFNLSPTDMEICAAALKEWLARELPDSEGNK